MLAFPGILLFLSGFSALVYEILWIREFGFLLGNATATLSAVLAAYMAGLAAGSRASAAVAGRVRRPLLAYGLAEIGIGVAGIAVHAILRGAATGIGPIGAAAGSPLLHAALRFGVAAAILLVPTALMGATLPLLARQAEGSGKRGPGTAMGWLYGLNTLGAACGCFIAGFFLIRLLGTVATNLVAVATNLGIGAAAVTAGLRVPAVGAASTGNGPPKLPTASAIPGFAAFACFACGFLALSSEIVCFRLLSWVVGNRVYASTVMLTAFLLGIALGSILAGWLADRLRRDILVFSACQAAAGLALAGSLLWFPDLLALSLRAEAEGGGAGTWAVVRARFAHAFLLVAVPAFMSGASFPALVRAIRRAAGDLGASAGRAYALNTAGCIAGSLATGFWLVPELGTHASAVLIAAGSILLGHRLLADRWEGAPLPWRAASVLLSVAVAGLAALAAFRRPAWPPPRPGLELVWSREEPAALVTVWRGGIGWHLYGDDTPLSFPIGPGSSALRVQRLQAWLPLLLHPEPRRILVVGLGFGVTTGALASSGVPASVETVELFRGAIECAPLFRDYNHDPARLPGSRIVEGDGRYYLRHGGHGWDVIAANLTEADLPGSASCYTLEFFELARSRLNPGGIFLIHAYGRDDEVIMKTVATVFPHVTAWRAYRNSHYLVAGLAPVDPDPALFSRRVGADPRLRARLRADGVGRFADFISLRDMDGAALRRIAARRDLPVNSDAFPVVEYRMTADPRDLFRAHF